MVHVYDSGDPDLPDLPRNLLFTNPSDEYSDDEQGHPLSDVETHEATSQEQPMQSESNQQRAEPTRLYQSTTHASYRKRRNRRKKKDRKYDDSSYSASAARQRISWEPGVDINTTEVIISSIGSAVTITDYSHDRYRVERVEVFSNTPDGSDVDTDGSTGSSTMKSEEQHQKEHSSKVEDSVNKLRQCLDSRPQWSKIRWINVNGLSWEAIAALGQKYNLHRLAIEDMIDIPQRTKIDFYPGLIFGVVPLVKLVRKVEIGNDLIDTASKWERFKSMFSLHLQTTSEPDIHHETQSDAKISLTEQIPHRHEPRRLNDSFNPTKYSKRRTKLLDDQRPLSYRKLFVGVEQCSFFMLDGIIISFFESSGDDIESAILTRISSDETILRVSCDVSILLEAILDAIVDITYPVITAYRKRLSELEVDILTNPDLRHTQMLHLMSGELNRLKRAIFPTSTMINSLRDLSRASTSSPDINIRQLEKSFSKSGYIISPLCDVYLADIVDHTMMFTDEIEGMVSNVENLIQLMFNTISTDTNEAMKKLSLVTVIFLPLSFWTGYYGMNFKSFGDLDHNVSYYWKIAVPFSVGLMILITWSFSRRSFSKYKRIVRKKINDFKTARDIKREKEKARQYRLKVMQSRKPILHSVNRGRVDNTMV